MRLDSLPIRLVFIGAIFLSNRLFDSAPFLSLLLQAGIIYYCYEYAKVSQTWSSLAWFLVWSLIGAVSLLIFVINAFSRP